MANMARLVLWQHSCFLVDMISPTPCLAWSRWCHAVDATIAPPIPLDINFLDEDMVLLQKAFQLGVMLEIMPGVKCCIGWRFPYAENSWKFTTLRRSTGSEKGHGTTEKKTSRQLWKPKTMKIELRGHHLFGIFAFQETFAREVKR